MPPSEEDTKAAAAAPSSGSDEEAEKLKALAEEAENTSLSLEDITDGKTDRGIPRAKFIDDIGKFAESFSPPASAELLIGAFSDLFSKFKTYEQSLSQKRKFWCGITVVCRSCIRVHMLFTDTSPVLAPWHLMT